MTSLVCSLITVGKRIRFDGKCIIDNNSKQREMEMNRVMNESENDRLLRDKLIDVFDVVLTFMNEKYWTVYLFTLITRILMC